MWTLLRNTLDAFLEDECPRMAAAVAYYTMFSLAPLLVIVLTIAGLVFDSADVRQRITEEVGRVVGQEGATQVNEMITSVSQTEHGAFSAIVGIGTLLFGATAVMVQLQAALNKVWHVKPNPTRGSIWSFVLKRLISLAMMLGVAILLLASLIVSWVLKALGGHIEEFLPGHISSWLWIAAHELALVVVASVFFAGMFKFVPDAKVRWRDVAVGAALTSLLMVAGKFAIGWYLGGSNVAGAYGAAGSLVLILIWVYYSSMILLLGAEFTQAWTHWRGRPIIPRRGAARIEQREVNFETADSNPTK